MKTIAFISTIRRASLIGETYVERERERERLVHEYTHRTLTKAISYAGLTAIFC